MVATVEQLAWVAGFIDGDGCISIGRSVKNDRKLEETFIGEFEKERYLLSVGASCTDVAVILKLSAVLKCGCASEVNRAGYLRQFKWLVSGKKAVSVLKLIRPYLVTKREEATLGIEFSTIGKDSPECWEYSVPIQKQIAWVKMKELKKKRCLRLYTEDEPDSYLVESRRSFHNAWMAGLVDAEGCIIVTGSIHLKVGMCDSNTIGYLSVCYPESTVRHVMPKWKQRGRYMVHRWRIGTYRAVNILRAIYPFMITKGPETGVLLRGAHLFGFVGKLTPAIRDGRTKVREKIKRLKHRFDKQRVA